MSEEDRVRGETHFHYFCLPQNLNNYFRFHICLSFHGYARPFVTLLDFLVVSQNVTNKSSLECAKSKRYAFLVTLRLLRSMRQGKAKLCTLNYQARRSGAAYIRTYFSVSSSPHCRSKVVVCVSTPRMHPKSWNFLVYSRGPNKCKLVQINVLAGKIVKMNNHSGPKKVMGWKF